MKRIVMYINQFFGGIGGEDKAGYEPSVEEGPVGPGNVILSCLKDAEITHTIICGDNFMTGHRDEAIERMDQFLEGIEFDLFLAGPAFQSGRYGMSCGEICKYITEKYHVTAITSMNEENPGVAAYAKHRMSISCAAVKARSECVRTRRQWQDWQPRCCQEKKFFGLRRKAIFLTA